MTSVDQLQDMSTSKQTNDTSTQTSIETAGNHEMAHKIDRLSLLPNELLAPIFDSAYSIDTPSTGALSKHLLPFHVIGIYRRVRLRKPGNLTDFIVKLRLDPQAAGMVEELDINVERDPSAGSIALDQLENSHFFRQLINLHTLHANQALVCRDGFRLLLLAYSPDGGALPRLRHLRISNLRGFEPLFLCLRWPTLQSITVTGYEHFQSFLPRRGYGQLTQLATLSISGQDSSSIAGFCHLCPFLTHLILSSEASNYYALLLLLPPTLLQLELYGCGFRVGEYCDRALSRFTSLQHLTLDNRLFSVDLPTHLLSLVSLETLHLGRGQISTGGMIQLLRPPTRLPSLHTLTFNLVTGRMGGRLQVNIDGSMENTNEELWEAPSFSQVGGAFSAEGVSEMLVVAEEAGVKVGGTILPALEVHKAHQLELANRAIYQCFEKQSLWAYRELIVDPSCNSRLPNLNLDCLHPWRLKLVRIALPRENWFALSLKNREDLEG